MITNFSGSNMNRILILNRRYCPGEAWTNRVLAYAKGFAELGEEVILCYLITNKERIPYEINIPGVRVINLWENDGFFYRKFRILSFIKNLFLFKSLIQPGDRLFMYGGYDYQLKIAMNIRAKAKVYCEVTEHPNINGNIKSRFHIVDINESMKKLDGLFVISQSLKDYYKSVGIREDRVIVSNMFVDPNRFKGLIKNAKQKYIAYCGTVSYEKDGCNILIEAFSLFHKQHPEYKLYIIGRGIANETVLTLEQLALEKGIRDNVIFTGLVSPTKIPQLLLNASILALARPDNLQAQHGFPTKLGEYLATGNPVVVTCVGEIPLFIKNGENGFLSEPNVDSFAEQLIWVADNYEQALVVGQKGKELVDTDFSYLSQSKKVLEIMNR